MGQTGRSCRPRNRCQCPGPLPVADSFVWPGSSGGGVFDEKGRLTAITVALYSKWDRVNLAPRLMENQGMAVAIGNVDVL